MKYIFIGKIVNTHGIRGEIRLISRFKYKNKVFIKGMPIYIGISKEREVINTYRPHKQFDMITLDGYDNINEILKYKGLNVYINSEDLNLESNEYLDEDLIGLKVIILNKVMGTISNIEDYKTYKLIIIKNNEKNCLIPYVSDIIENIDFEKKEIYIKEDLLGLFNK